MPNERNLSQAQWSKKIHEQLVIMTDRLEKTETVLLNLTERLVHTMSEMDDKITQLQADVAAESAGIDSAVALINGFAQQLADAIAAAQAAGATPAQLQSMSDLHDAVVADTQRLAAAVVAPPAVP